MDAGWGYGVWLVQPSKAQIACKVIAIAPSTRSRASAVLSNTKKVVMNAELLIYGANGYTGALIARTAVAQGLRPRLAGRNQQAVAALAAELNLDHCAFALEDRAALHDALHSATLVIHCAGPFAHTSRLMADACLHTHTHYFDITGEAAVFEALAARDSEARATGVMLLPGVGFDVVPSDCLAAHLKARLPTACYLTLAFQALGRMSRGTATTAVENIHRGGLVRRDGVLTPVPAAHKTRAIDFGRGPRVAVAIPWGDVATAFYSTGIPNIEVYMALPTSARRLMLAGRAFSWLFKTYPVQRILTWLVGNQPPGPSDAERAQGFSLLWGEVRDAAGTTRTTRMRTPEAYTLTALTAVAAARKVLAGQAPPGFQTPARAYGADFIMEIPGVSREDLS